MKAIGKREHTAIISVLQKLHELEQSCVSPADGFLLHVQSLSERYKQYESLLAQLTNCIAEYETLYRDIRVNVVAPALRQARRQLNKDSTKTVVLKEHLKIT